MKQEMIDAAYEAREEHMGLPLRDKTVLNAMLGAGISKAWTTFNPDNPDTWPKSEYAPSGKYWVCVMRGSGAFVLCLWHDEKFEDAEKGWAADFVTMYADPADLLRTNTEE